MVSSIIWKRSPFSPMTTSKLSLIKEIMDRLNAQVRDIPTLPPVMFPPPIPPEGLAPGQLYIQHYPMERSGKTWPFRQMAQCQTQEERDRVLDAWFGPGYAQHLRLSAEIEGPSSLTEADWATLQINVDFSK